MFYCQATNELSRPNEASCKLTTHVRPVLYRRSDLDPGTRGWEIAREITVSKDVFVKLHDNGFIPEPLPEVIRYVKYGKKKPPREERRDREDS